MMYVLHVLSVYINDVSTQNYTLYTFLLYEIRKNRNKAREDLMLRLLFIHAKRKINYS